MAMEPDENRETNEVVTALNGLREAIEKVVTYRPPEQSSFILSANRQATHVRMRIYSAVLTASAAAVVTLQVGGIAYTFPFAAADTKVVPLSIVVERGQDVFFTTTGGAGSTTGYLIYTPE